MKIKKIVSFLPSATELIYELQSEEQLYGVTHECIYPKKAQDKPQVISSVVDSEKLSSNEINNITCKLLQDGQDIFILNEESLKRADPDLIITQETCEVCAAHTNQTNNAIKILKKKPIIHSMDPHSLEEILSSVIEVGKILEKQERAKEIKNELLKRINHVKNHSESKKRKVLAIEWLEPFFSAGHWIPEMIEIAGGSNLISKAGEHSKKITMQEILQSEPEVVILMPCGFNTQRTIEEYNEILSKNQEWNKIKAVKNNAVFAVDANSFFSKPSIRTITGLEILAKILQPENFESLKIPKDSFVKIPKFIEV
jgi:iron complex transport system substrate-binding protein